MKKHIFVLLIFVGFSLAIKAQNLSPIPSTKHTVYVNAGLAVWSSGNQTTSLIPIINHNYGINYLYNEKWGIAVNKQEFFENDPNVPNDYNYEGFFGNTAPNLFISAHNIRLIRAFSVGSKKRQRYTIETGPSFNKQSYVQYTKLSEANYETNRVNRKFEGLNLKMGVQHIFTSLSSIEFSLNSNINKYQSFVTADVHFNFGNLRVRKSNL
jgi:hypothetical protein